MGYVLERFDFTIVTLIKFLSRKAKCMDHKFATLLG